MNKNIINQEEEVNDEEEEEDECELIEQEEKLA